MSGCSVFTENPVYVKPGQIVELAENIRFKGWVINAETGKRERRKVDTAKCPGSWWAGREKADAK